jgi:hypothetical protein
VHAGGEVTDFCKLLEINGESKRPHLVVLSACKSERIGRVLRDAGIRFVIAVTGDRKIKDKACMCVRLCCQCNI